jgi:hypothetical protein
VAGTIWVLEHAQDLMSVIVGVLLVVLAAVVLVVGVVDFFRDAVHGPVETAAVSLLDQVLLVLILIESVHTVVLSLRPPERRPLTGRLSPAEEPRASKHWPPRRAGGTRTRDLVHPKHAR